MTHAPQLECEQTYATQQTPLKKIMKLSSSFLVVIPYSIVIAVFQFHNPTNAAATIQNNRNNLDDGDIMNHQEVSQPILSKKGGVRADVLMSSSSSSLDRDLEEGNTNHKNDTKCANICNGTSTVADTSSSLFMSLSVNGTKQGNNVDVNVNDDEDTSTNGFLGRMSGMVQRFLTSLFNTFFNRIQPPRDDDPKFMVSTTTIVPVLTKYSTKLKSFAYTIRQESVSLSGIVNPVIVRTLYNMSAENMESIATFVLDPIIEEMQQQERNNTMDIVTMSCRMMQLLILIRDTTLPNIEWIAQELYSGSDNTEMQSRLNQLHTNTTRTNTMPSDTGMIMTSNNNNNNNDDDRTTCVDVSPASTTGTDVHPVQLFNHHRRRLQQNPDITRATVTIVLLILALPLSFVVSIVALVVTIIAGILTLIQGPTSFDFLAVIFLFVLSPILVVGGILQNVRILLEALADNDPSTTPPSSETVVGDTTVTDDRTFTDVMYRLFMVLDAPFETIYSMVQNRNDNDNNDNEQVKCDIAVVECYNDALMNSMNF